jgi:hypothetical protein
VMLIALLITWNAHATQAAIANARRSDVEALRQLTLARFEANARNDRAFYERLLAPVFQMQDPHSFPPATKQEYLAAEFPAGRPRRPASTMTGFHASVDGDTAVTRYEITEPYPIGGAQHFEMRSRRLDTYVRLDGVWRLLSIAVAEPPGWPDVAAVDPTVYAEYAGIYQLSADTSITVTHDDRRLMAQVTGQERVELFPENATTFFDRTDSPLARTVFERDASGKVVAQIYRAQGQRLRAQKIK